MTLCDTRRCHTCDWRPCRLRPERRRWSARPLVAPRLVGSCSSCLEAARSISVASVRDGAKLDRAASQKLEGRLVGIYGKTGVYQGFSLKRCRTPLPISYQESE